MSEVAVHVLAIQRNDNQSSPTMPDELLITIMNRNGQILQFGPQFTKQNRERIVRILGNTRCPKVGYDILWSALDINRIFPDLGVIKPLLHVPEPTLSPNELEASRILKPPPVYKRHVLNDHTRTIGRQLVQDAMRSRLIAIELPDVYATFGNSIVNRYTRNLHLWRYKWLEIQDVEVDIKGYTLSIPPGKVSQGRSLSNHLTPCENTQSCLQEDSLSQGRSLSNPLIPCENTQSSSEDSDAPDEEETWQDGMRSKHQVGHNASRPMTFFVLHQTQWRSHIRSGTKLRIVTKQREYKAIIHDIKLTRVRFAIFGHITSTQGKHISMCMCMRNDVNVLIYLP